ncbi:MAG: ribbon-helix-helix protein, CopG family [Actinomycetota bacterium]|nr:ribbon-helix-helix protein, CopG family [Actinomycetota bacterium]
MTSKKINITIPEKNLKEINQFCASENISKSLLIREAASKYITGVKNERELDKKRKEMKWAEKTMEKLRKKGSGFTGKKNGAEVIREFREKGK